MYRTTCVAAGICKQLLEADLQLPVLGVCLGMQALAVSRGASVRHAPEPIHGRLSRIEHSGHTLLHNIPSGNTTITVASPSCNIAAC